MDSLGNIIWEKSFGGSGTDRGFSIRETPDHGYIFSGETASPDGDVTNLHGSRDAWVVKLSSTGTIQWQKCLGGTGQDAGLPILVTNTGNYIILCQTQSNDGDVSGNHGNVDIWIVSLDSTGTIQWQKCIGGSNLDWSISLVKDWNGGYLINGYSYSNNGDVACTPQLNDIWILKLDDNGNILWQKCLGGSMNDFGFSIVNAYGGGYLQLGWVNSNDGDISGNHGIYDVWIAKLSAPVSTNESSLLHDLQIFPNPANDMLYLNHNEEFTFSLFDLQGNPIRNPFNGNSVNISTLSPGMYFLKIEHENHSEYRKIIKE